MTDWQLVSSSGDALESPHDALAVAVPDPIEDSALAVRLDEKLGGALRRMIEAEQLKLDCGKVATWYSPPGMQVKLLLVVGAGKRSDVGPAERFQAAAAATRAAATTNLADIALAGFTSQDHSANSDDAVVAGALTGPITQDLYRQRKKPRPQVQLTIYADRELSTMRGQAIASGVELARRLVNQPPNYLYPESFVDAAVDAVEGQPIEAEVWDQERLTAERCGALLGVAQGSDRPPRLMILRYKGDASAASLQPVALVGKGVTFDSGGLSIKPSDGMLTMKCDMAGAATVVGAMLAAAKMKIRRPIIGVVGLVENMISGRSFRLGDVLTSRAGKTIEVHNTDAEGRLVLADALDIACDANPSHIVDFATLTGACVVALGNDVGGVMSNDDWLTAQLRGAAEQTGELLWPLPMFKLFDEQVESKVADLKNVGDGRWGGAITAAKFLERFVRDVPWAHIDLAGPAFADKPKPWRDAGGTGYFVHTIAHWLDSLGTDSLPHAGTNRSDAAG